MQKALVIGYGISGQGAEKLLRKHGYDVTVVDQKLQAPNHAFDIAILSPGIPQTHPIPALLEKKGVEVIGEVELALRYLKNRCIGVTGTNGKTTLTEFLAHVLKGQALGNVGTSLAAYAAENHDVRDILVIELSSFQLETMTARALDYGIITSITPDHLDRYPSFEAYANTKWRIVDCLKEGGWCFVPETLKALRHPQVQIVKEDSYLHLTLENGYWGNSRFAWAVCKKLGVSMERFTAALKTFNKPSHRLETVCKINGVQFINDSKGTNPAATLHAVDVVGGNILLIVGGDNKGLSFEPWKEGLKEKVKALFAIGKASRTIKQLLSPTYDVHETQTLEKAIKQALKKAKPGDTILLSPGCASFDQFKNYAHRGDVFKENVRQLRRGL